MKVIAYYSRKSNQTEINCTSSVEHGLTLRTEMDVDVPEAVITSCSGRSSFTSCSGRSSLTPYLGPLWTNGSLHAAFACTFAAIPVRIAQAERFTSLCGGVFRLLIADGQPDSEKM